MGKLYLANLPDVWAIVPVKRLRLAKQRLAFCLSEDERLELATSMLTDVLASLHRSPDVAGILVVTSDPDVSQLAAPFGATIIADELEAGTNSAVVQGLRSLESLNSAILVAPADVPFATSDDFSSVIRALRADPVVLSPATSDGGTNALAMRSGSLVAPCFGEDSFVRHITSASQKRLECGVVRSWGLGHDVDRPDDLLDSSGFRNSQSRTATFLAGLNVADRLGLSGLPACVRYM